MTRRRIRKRRKYATRFQGKEERKTWCDRSFGSRERGRSGTGRYFPESTRYGVHLAHLWPQLLERCAFRFLLRNTDLYDPLSTRVFFRTIFQSSSFSWQRRSTSRPIAADRSRFPRTAVLRDSEASLFYLFFPSFIFIEICLILCATVD